MDQVMDRMDRTAVTVEEYEIRELKQKDWRHPWRNNLEALSDVLSGKIPVPHDNMHCVECELIQLRIVRNLILENGEPGPNEPSRLYCIEDRIQEIS